MLGARKNGRTLGSYRELAAIRALTRCLPERADVVCGAGDDCAVVRPVSGGRYNLLLKSDPVIEGAHFLPETPAAAVGHKALGRVLSDLAAMGGEPLWALVNISAPARTVMRRINGIYAGINRLARRWRMAIVGGDLASGPVLALNVFVVGRVPRGRALMRSGARPGDYLFVTGSLGGSRKAKHLSFEPRLREGIFLQAGGFASAMIDLSDGLASDLRHLTERSGVGAELVLDALPVAPELRRGCSQAVALRHVLCDGEDYELLFATPPRKAPALMRAWPERRLASLTMIGKLNNRRGRIECVDSRGRRKLLKGGGYEHFA